MAITTAVAKQLCSKSEFTLFTESASKNVKSIDAKGLRSRITRARKLQDKYRQLASRQEREARGKQMPQGKRAAAGSGATRKKEQAFAEARERFEKQLAKLQAAAKKKDAKKPAKKAVKKKTVKKTAKKAAKKKRPQKSPPPDAKKKVPKKKSGVSRTTKTKSTSAKISGSGRVNRQKHRSADNKRRQARRDTRSSR